MSDDELKREAEALNRETWRCNYDESERIILAALRRVRDAATAAERKRCAEVCLSIERRIHAETTQACRRDDYDAAGWLLEQGLVARECAAAIMRQDGEG